MLQWRYHRPLRTDLVVDLKLSKGPQVFFSQFRIIIRHIAHDLHFIQQSEGSRGSDRFKPELLKIRRERRDRFFQNLKRRGRRNPQRSDGETVWNWWYDRAGQTFPSGVWGKIRWLGKKVLMIGRVDEGPDRLF
jgi:hypothetical protein